MSTTVTYKGSTLTTVNNQTRTLKTAGKYLEDDVTLVDVSGSTINNQNKSVNPTESEQSITYDSGYTGLGTVTVGAISSTYVGTGIARKSSADLTANGSTITVPTGYYSSQVTKSISSGNAFTPAITITTNPTISVNAATGAVTASYSGGSNITPTVTSGYISSGTAGRIATAGTVTYSLATQAATTYNTSNTDRTIASYQWLTGTQTIKSVTTENILASNIKSGVTVKVGDTNNASRITQVTGTLVEGEDVPVFTLTFNSDWSTVTSATCNKTFSEVDSRYTNYSMGDAIVKTVSSSGETDTEFATNIRSYRSSGKGNYYEYCIFNISPTMYINFYEDGTIEVEFPATRYMIQAQTITPTTTNQILSSQYFLAGRQTILGDANLVASNIASGVSIFGVTGTHSGGGLTCTISGNGSSTTVYIKYNNQKYYTNGDTFVFQAGDEISFYCVQGGTNSIILNGETVATTSYTLTASGNIEVQITKSNGYSHIDITASIIPTGTYNITSNGIFNVANYASASVNVAGGGGITADEIAMQTISGDISGNATFIGNHAFYNCRSLTTASFPNATSISSYAFYSCTNLTTVSFPSVRYIGTYAFCSCTNLTTASFPNATSINTYAFCSCTNLTTASFPNATSIGGSVFAYCRSLITISFPKATSIGAYAFQYCRSLTTASFPKATTISTYAFSNCTNLTTASFPSVTFIANHTFRSCYHLLSLYLLGSSMCTNGGTSTFTNTPIAGHTTSTGGVYGSVFVPASLYDSYISATNWVTYSSRFVSV